jgi:hypothetical protein
MDKIEKLISFCGYGNFESANIIFMGNEEGLGGGAIEDEITKRTCKFWEEGKAIDGIEKANGYYVGKQTYADTRGPFLEFSSRLMKYLNSMEHTDYFKKNSEDPGTFQEIKRYNIYSLFCGHSYPAFRTWFLISTPNKQIMTSTFCAAIIFSINRFEKYLRNIVYMINTSVMSIMN